MSLLFKHLRVHQVFGANTDVGKTILTTALVRASAAQRDKVFYLKPVSTGPPQDADDAHVTSHMAKWKDRVQTHCLFRFQEPVSPHLAVKRAGASHSIPDDDTLANTIAAYVRRAASQCGPAHMYIETAGGVQSPTLSGVLQADLYRRLFLPAILVGDSKLGGISTTISAYESLLLRGYDVDAILLFEDDYYRNFEYLHDYFKERNVDVFTTQPPPPKLAAAAENFAATEKYYADITSSDHHRGVTAALEHLDTIHNQRISYLGSMATRARDTIWWPFVQHGHVKTDHDVNVIHSAYSDFFSVYNPSHRANHAANNDSSTANPSPSLLNPQYDGSASWWTQALGHAHPSLTLAAARVSGRYGHVMFPQATHAPALQLAETLVHDGPGRGWASKAFFSDDGSTGMEVAIKMALRFYTKAIEPGLPVEAWKQLGILGLKGSYHGDTIGTMDACEEGVYTCEWHNAKGYWFEPPTVSVQDGQATIALPSSFSVNTLLSPANYGFDSLGSIYDVESRLETPLAKVYRDHLTSKLKALHDAGGPRLAALVLEPLVMGAGGMIFVDPLFQRVMVEVVKAGAPGISKGLPVIFDEVFVGLYRLGMESTAPLLGVKPDISVHAKILTGGLLPLAITLASQPIFEAFLGDSKASALLHGHSYTAHPIGCEVANETLSIIRNTVSSDSWIEARKKWQADADRVSSVFSLWDPSFVKALSRLPQVKEVMTLGTVLALKISDGDSGYVSMSAQATFQSLKQLNDDPNAQSVAPGGAPYNVHYRTLGDIAYFMTSLNTSPGVIRSMEERIWSALEDNTP
ncbi:hypothetical protein HGRIS_003645 [Hohenbuehelia grisea]|uniref:PLP-dependent transferase n=1 Tax=Hohenbuehelia grisea TaxID=104357 RepID=A0ABR3JGJ3_9AGAR